MALLVLKELGMKKIIYALLAGDCVVDSLRWLASTRCQKLWVVQTVKDSEDCLQTGLPFLQKSFKVGFDGFNGIPRKRKKKKKEEKNPPKPIYMRNSYSGSLSLRSDLLPHIKFQSWMRKELHTFILLRYLDHSLKKFVFLLWQTTKFHSFLFCGIVIHQLLIWIRSAEDSISIRTRNKG